MVDLPSRTWRFIRRWLEVVAGFGLLIAGVLMLVLPGPGLATIVAGLALLGRQFTWARRANVWALRRLVQAKNRVTRRKRRRDGDDVAQAVHGPPPGP